MKYVKCDECHHYYELKSPLGATPEGWISIVIRHVHGANEEYEFCSIQHVRDYFLTELREKESTQST